MEVTSVAIERPEKNRVKLTIEVPPETLEEGLAKSYKKNARRFSVPGFRKGKAPRSYVERMYGEEALYEDAIDFICPDCYEQAVKDHGIAPVDTPELTVDTMKKGEPFVFSLIVTVRPDVTLGQYKGISASYEQILVTDDDVDAYIAKIAEERARLVPVEGRPAQEGDTVVIDFVGSIEGVPFDGGAAESQSLELGSGRFIPGFEDQVAGKAEGESFVVSVKFPDNYQAKELAGKDAEFAVTLHSIKRKELPEIDDEFASEISEHDTLAEYKIQVRDEIAQSRDREAASKFEGAVVDKAVDNAEVEIPSAMIARQAESDMRQFQMQAAYRGFENIDQYLTATGESPESFKNRIAEMSERSVRTQLVLDAIGKAEGISATDEDLEKDLRDRAARYKKDYDSYEKTVDDDMRSRIMDRLEVAKIVAFLVENAVKEN